MAEAAWRRPWAWGTAAAAGVLLLAACGSPTGGTPQMQTVPLPRLPAGPVTLRVAHVLNPRIERMDEGQVQALLAALAVTAQAHFGVELRFSEVSELPIARVFAGIPARNRAQALSQIYDFKNGQGDTARLLGSFGRALENGGEPLDAQLAYARPHIGTLAEPSFGALGAALGRLQLERIGRWRDLQALDGRPVMDAQPYNEFPMWVAAGYSELPYELLLTNQPIASVEYGYTAVHSAVRGGYSNGLTTYSRRARFKSLSVWSSFAFTSADTWVAQMREGEDYSAEEAARLAGIAAAHEIGHQLFHFMHPFGQEACVMNPVPMFAYRAWAAKLVPADCRAGSSAAMRPGSARMLYEEQ